MLRRSSTQVLPCGHTLAIGTCVTRGPRSGRQRRSDFKTILHASGLVDDREFIALEALEMLRRHEGANSRASWKRPRLTGESMAPKSPGRSPKTTRTHSERPSCFSKQPNLGRQDEQGVSGLLSKLSTANIPRNARQDLDSSGFTDKLRLQPQLLDEIGSVLESLQIICQTETLTCGRRGKEACSPVSSTAGTHTLCHEGLSTSSPTVEFLELLITRQDPITLRDAAYALCKTLGCNAGTYRRVEEQLKYVAEMLSGLGLVKKLRRPQGCAFKWVGFPPVKEDTWNGKNSNPHSGVLRSVTEPTGSYSPSCRLNSDELGPSLHKLKELQAQAPMGSTPSPGSTNPPEAQSAVPTPCIHQQYSSASDQKSLAATRHRGTTSVVSQKFQKTEIGNAMEFVKVIPPVNNARPVAKRIGEVSSPPSSETNASPVVYSGGHLNKKDAGAASLTGSWDWQTSTSQCSTSVFFTPIVPCVMHPRKCESVPCPMKEKRHAVSLNITPTPTTSPGCKLATPNPTVWRITPDRQKNACTGQSASCHLERVAATSWVCQQPVQEFTAPGLSIKSINRSVPSSPGVWSGKPGSLSPAPHGGQWQLDKITSGSRIAKTMSSNSTGVSGPAAMSPPSSSDYNTLIALLTKGAKCDRDTSLRAQGSIREHLPNQQSGSTIRFIPREETFFRKGS